MGNKMINCLCLYMRKAIPFGLQHVLAMFVANLAPVLIVCSAALVRGSGEHLTAAEITQILQCAMFAAGIGTCMQLYPIWKIGSKLPIVMGVSFTFLGSLLIIRLVFLRLVFFAHLVVFFLFLLLLIFKIVRKLSIRKEIKRR